MSGDDERPTDPRAGWVRDHLHRYVATDGDDGHEWRPGVPTLLLTTRGRRSGRLRRTPLIYGRDGDRYVVVASYGGRPQHPDWYFNLSDDPEVEIQVGPDVMPARASTVADADRERLWGVMTGIWPDYDQYQAKTDRVIPIVTLEPGSS
jgi:deazaflavin-dependent oxidoreductase (nitroreductase family)